METYVNSILLFLPLCLLPSFLPSIHRRTAHTGYRILSAKSSKQSPKDFVAVLLCMYRSPYHSYSLTLEECSYRLASCIGYYRAHVVSSHKLAYGTGKVLMDMWKGEYDYWKWSSDCVQQRHMHVQNR